MAHGIIRLRIDGDTYHRGAVGATRREQAVHARVSAWHSEGQAGAA